MSTPLTPPADRYPDTKDPSKTRRILQVGGVVVVILGVLIAWLGYQKFADDAVTGEAVGYELVSDSSVAVQISVTRKDPSRPVSCIITAKNRDGAEIGRREVLIAPGKQKVEVITKEVRATEPPAIGTVFGCGTAIPAYLDR
jgi:hypothetical protein